MPNHSHQATTRGAREASRPLADSADLNLIVAGLLSDLATIQTSVERHWGYRRAARAIRGLEAPLEHLVGPDGTPPRIRGIGPASLRVIEEVLRTGASEWVERAVADSPKCDEVTKRRALRSGFLSRARVRGVLDDDWLAGPRLSDYRGDLQMHSTWSDGSQSLGDIVAIGVARGYSYAAVTDHSAGLPIARGVSSGRLADQRREIAQLNREHRDTFRLLAGVEANIRADGVVDVEPADRRAFDVVVAAPHSNLRKADLQTERLLRAVETPGVHILGHPRGRIYGSRPGVAADWPRVFAAAAASGVAIEIDGDPSRQDVDWRLAREALDAGCLFALDSDAHATDEWTAAEYAIAHARLAGIPPERVVNCWALERLMDWARERSC